ncbi:MAG: nuclear transport factor 2 family protein [Streptosporangiaceae bacterium]
MIGDSELSARAAQVLYAYARGVDEGDLEALGELVSDDVKVSRADGELNGRDEFVGLYRAFLDSPVEASQHLVGNVAAYRESPGMIRALAYFTAIMFDPDGCRLITGSYSDTFREEADRLVLVHKRIEIQRAIKLSAQVMSWQGIAAK